MPFRELAVALALVGCAPPPEAARAPAAPQGEPAQPARSAVGPPPAPVASSVASSPLPPPVAPSPPPAPAEPEVRIVLEEPYKLEGRPPPKTQEAYARDIHDRRHWNGGGLGELAGEQAKVEGHPDPRVIVNVEAIEGGLEERKVVVFARKYHWIEVVRCYRLGAYKDPHLRGWTRARVKIGSDGKVRDTRMIDTELDDEAVARCMAERLGSHTFPAAGSASRVTFAMRVGPGDEPMPPPDDLIVPGDGELSGEQMREGVAAGLPAFAACYREARAYAPGLWGRMILRFHVTEHGRLDEAFQINRRFPDPRMSQCVEHAARKLVFARPKGGDIRFVVPLRFWTDRADTAPPSSDKDK